MSLCVLPETAVPKMTYTVLGRMLNPTHSLTKYTPMHMSIHTGSVFWLSGKVQ